MELVLNSAEHCSSGFNKNDGRMAELVYAYDSKSYGAIHEGSIPSSPTICVEIKKLTQNRVKQPKIAHSLGTKLKTAHTSGFYIILILDNQPYYHHH